MTVNIHTITNKALVVCLMLLMTSLMAKNTLAQDEVYVPEEDSLALVAFYHALNGDTWQDKGGWLVDRVDTWEGITTENMGTEADPEWRVVEIYSRRNIVDPGYITPELGNIEYLVDLDLRNEPIFGEIPPELGQLEYLDFFRLQATSVGGEVPWEALVNCERLEQFRIQGSYVYGEIPGMVSAWEQMRHFRIDGSYMSGTIPDEITEWENLEQFRLDGNLLTGDLPDMSVFEELTQIDIDNNPLTPGPVWEWLKDGYLSEKMDEFHFNNTNRIGEFPEWFGDEMFAIERLSFGEITPGIEHNGQTGLGGEVPENLRNLVNLDRLNIYGVYWEGSIPEWFGELDRLTLQNCSFTGEIPGSLVSLDRIYIINCPNIEGGLPPEFVNFTGTNFEWENDPVDGPWGPPGPVVEGYEDFNEEFYGDPKAQVGELQDWLGDWGTRRMSFSGVGVTGTIPDGLQNNDPMWALNLSNNPDLTGPIPEWLANFPMRWVNFSNTGLEVPEIPEWMNNSTWHASLDNLYLAGLGIGGEIPDWIGDFTLGNLDLSDNNLIGSIPESIGELRTMGGLSLANNQLSGELPVEIRNLGYFMGTHTLNRLDLSGNEELTGELPLRLAEAGRFRVLRYNDTGIWAPDDPKFENWLENVVPGNTGLSYPPAYTDVQTSGLVGPPVSAKPPESPYQFNLSENYPNPFNPATTISYEIPAEGHVTLTIYNVIGQQVATLVSEVQTAGSYQVTFDAESLSSGTYLYRLRSGNQTMTRSMMLVK